MRKPPNLFFFRHFTKLFVSKQKKFNRYTTDNRHFTLTLGILVIIMMLQAINSKRKSDGNDCTENISNQTFKRLIAIYFIQGYINDIYHSSNLETLRIYDRYMRVLFVIVIIDRYRIIYIEYYQLSIYL